MVLHGDVFAYLSLSVCILHTLCWASVRSTALHAKAMVQTEKKEEPALGRRAGFRQGAMENQAMTLGLKTAVEERD